MTSTIVFDVNETLLDLSALNSVFEDQFGAAEMRHEWFAQVLLSAMTLTVVGDYANFGEVASAALEMVAERRGLEVSESRKAAVLTGLRSLPPHPEARAALELARENRMAVAALTNSPLPVVRAQLESSGLLHMFDRVMSVDVVKAFKPARTVYDMAARELGKEPGSLWLVAAHNWDTSGAVAAGWKAAFIARPGMVIGPLDREPSVRAVDLVDAVAQIVARTPTD